VGATDNFLYCLSTDRGAIDWRWRTGADVVGAPVADGERVYFLALDNMLRGLDRRGGTQEWKRPLPMRPRGGPMLARGILVVGGLSPTLRAYSALNGAPAGEVALPTDLAAPLHLYTDGALPQLIAVTSDIARGATVLGFIRAMEPAAQPMAPLPNPTPAPAVPIQ
jgi:outer membrane protein assembly factor BamB